MIGAGRRSSMSANMEASCGALLRELELIWTDIGETEVEKDHMLLQLEKECMQVYRRMVDEASSARARLHERVASKEAELAVLRATLGENTTQSQMNKGVSLKKQLDLLTPSVEELRLEKKERQKLLAEITSQIENLNRQLEGLHHPINSICKEETDLSLRNINEYQAQLRNLQKEKSERVRKIIEDVNEVQCLCGVLGIDMGRTLDEVHPDLKKVASSGQSANDISNSILNSLSQVIQKLKNEKKFRAQKLRNTLESLYELWNLMDSNEEARKRFEKLKFISDSSDNDIKTIGILSLETLEEATADLERLTKLKASRLKELVLNKRMELEELCRWAHIEPDSSTAPDKISAVIDSGIVDPFQLLDNIEIHIEKAREEAISRTDIMDRVGKWLVACDEEKWLEDYNQDNSRYNAGRGAHLNLKRAEKARIIIAKIPGIVDNLIRRTIAWENERNKPFMYDAVQLITILEDYKIARQQKEEENRRYRDLKKMQDKESLYRLKPSPSRCNSMDRRANGVQNNGNRTAKPRRTSAGNATPDLLSPRSCSDHQNGYFKGTRRCLSTKSLNFAAMQKDDTTTSSFASVSGSDSGPPSLY